MTNGQSSFNVDISLPIINFLTRDKQTLKTKRTKQNHSLGDCMCDYFLQYPLKPKVSVREAMVRTHMNEKKGI